MAFLNLWVDMDGKLYPRWEIFFEEKLTFKKKPIVVIMEVRREVAWMDYLDAEAIETILNMEGDVFVVTNEKPSYPSTFIMPNVGCLNN